MFRTLAPLLAAGLLSHAPLTADAQGPFTAREAAARHEALNTTAAERSREAYDAHQRLEAGERAAAGALPYGAPRYGAPGAPTVGAPSDPAVGAPGASGVRATGDPAFATHGAPVAAAGAQPYGGTVTTGAPQALAAPAPQSPRATYSSDELVEAGHAFFGEASAGLAAILERLLSDFGDPNGYILGEEGAGAFVGGLRYGEGTLYTRAFGNQEVFWQGPSLGWDFGGSGSRVMMLVYDLPHPQALFQRYTGVDGSAYLVGGLSMTVMAADHTYVVPVRTGVGARLGVSLGYLKFTTQPTWNPF